jgi:HEAT repeat protein
MSVEGLRSRAREVQHGFKPLVALAAEIEERHIDDVLEVADGLWDTPDHQSRMVATTIWGDLASRHPELLDRLRNDVSADPDWRVHEMLARAFATWCIGTGWESARPTLASWLSDERPTVRRAATDALKRHPELAP